MESSRKCQADMIFIEWLSFCGTKNRHIKKDLPGLLNVYFIGANKKGS